MLIVLFFWTQEYVFDSPAKTKRWPLPNVEWETYLDLTFAEGKCVDQETGQEIPPNTDFQRINPATGKKECSSRFCKVCDEDKGTACYIGKSYVFDYLSVFIFIFIHLIFFTINIHIIYICVYFPYVGKQIIPCFIGAEQCLVANLRTMRHFLHAAMTIIII